uniref:Uncharacterized protein n=1 Tax=Rhizophora mucronata TaxID=61149 RepID=A0A2P2MSZ3_RHIMU
MPTPISTIIAPNATPTINPARAPGGSPLGGPGMKAAGVDPFGGEAAETGGAGGGVSWPSGGSETGEAGSDGGSPGGVYETGGAGGDVCWSGGGYVPAGDGGSLGCGDDIASYFPASVPASTSSCVPERKRAR